MAIDTEVQNWAEEMVKSGGLKMEDLQPILSNEAAAGYVKKSLKAQSEFSRSMDKLREKEREIQEKENHTLSLQADLIKWRNEEAEPQLRNANRALEKLQGERAVIMARLNTLKEAYQIPSEELSDLLTVPAEPKKTELNPSYLTREEFTKDASAVVRQFPRLVGQIRHIERQHEKLFGVGSFPDIDSLMEEQEKSGEKLMDVWEKKYNVLSKRQEIEAASRKTEIEKGIKEGVNARLSEMNLPGESTRRAAMGERQGSPVLEGLKKATTPETQERKSASQTHRQPGQLARNAAQAWSEGKYREEKSA